MARCTSSSSFLMAMRSLNEHAGLHFKYIYLCTDSGKNLLSES